MLSTPLPASTDHAFFSGPRGSSKGASSSTTTNVVVTTRLTRRSPPPQTAVSAKRSLPPAHPAPAPPDRSSPFSDLPSPPKKRRLLPSVFSSPLSDVVVPSIVKRAPAPASKEQKPRKRSSRSSSKASSRGSSRPAYSASSPEPISLSSRSRSTSSFPQPSPLQRRHWRTDENGAPGEGFLSSEEVVKRLMKSYKSYFMDPNDPENRCFDPHPTDYPVVELEYPNTNAKERYILLAPKDKDHYNPIMDLEKSLYTIVGHYCTREQQALFGPIPTDTLSESISRSPSPEPSCPPPLDLSFDPSTISLPTPSTPYLLKTLKRALYRQDGPTFVKVLEEINSILRSFKTGDNSLMRTPFQWTESGFPEKVMMRIIEENYQRTVGPNVPKLRHYEAFSSTVYGELMPNLVEDILRITNLREDSLFLDLGSGVANVVVQASLQTGCESYGIELMEAPARVAVDVVDQIKVRARMWGVRIGEMELEKGDMLKSARVDTLMSKADVVLVDNKVFEESLNAALRPKFLDLKEGAIVISLAPFVSSIYARPTGRNVDEMTAIFDVKERPYHSGSVSWGNGGGSYFVHRVDRAGYSLVKEKYERERGATRKTRSSRRRPGPAEFS
ncbi:hypothetical protein EST38_g10773 [Candolleomyces aberdarensis]|uniref:Histone-lysine N-methyltransferase, H3 lysine-79 specific n=1 Tax=Candolleomyces aberdarensis TaxID=2316362 RepID=A0A4Q2D9U8_9AGAR|nr:hypothetical protein EST38_g10773 [Candolleomyces aberdarensis]